MEDDMSSKDALFALDTTMEEDMKEYQKEVTLLTIKHINSTPRLYNHIKNVKEQNQNIKFACQGWAKQHNNEFGDLFVTELDLVDWAEVTRRV